MNEFERQLKAWERRERLGPGCGPVDTRQPGGYSADELRFGLSSPTQPLPADYFKTPEPITFACALEPEETLHAAWLRGQILGETGVVSEKRTLEWIELRIRKFR